MQTAPLPCSEVLNDRPVNLFSDLMVHHMGPNLADDIIQGQAGPDEFRTVPLWGVGQRLFFLHDGRTSDLLQAIYAHRSPASSSSPRLKRTRSSTTSKISRFQTSSRSSISCDRSKRAFVDDLVPDMRGR